MHRTETGAEEDGGGKTEKRTWSQRADLGEESQGEASSPHTQSTKMIRRTNHCITQ